MIPCHFEVAWNFFPLDGLKDMYLIQTYGDGNCFPHAISKLVFGEETSHYEIHARIIVAGIVNENKLTRESFLSSGEKNVRSNSLSSSVCHVFRNKYRLAQVESIGMK